MAADVSEPVAIFLPRGDYLVLHAYGGTLHAFVIRPGEEAATPLAIDHAAAASIRAALGAFLTPKSPKAPKS